MDNASPNLELVQFPQSLSQNYLTLPATHDHDLGLLYELGLLYMTVALWFTTMYKALMSHLTRSVQTNLTLLMGFMQKSYSYVEQELVYL